MERIKVYFDAVALYHEVDVEAAVESFLSGSAPGVNNFNFAPPAPLFASECRRLMNLRLEQEARRRKPALPPPDIVKTPESRERVRQKAQAVIAQLAELSRTDDAKKAHERKRWQDRQDARFMPPQDEKSLRERLHIGDPDGERDVA